MSAAFNVMFLRGKIDLETIFIVQFEMLLPTSGYVIDDRDAGG